MEVFCLFRPTYPSCVAVSYRECSIQCCPWHISGKHSDCSWDHDLPLLVEYWSFTLNQNKFRCKSTSLLLTTDIHLRRCAQNYSECLCFDVLPKTIIMGHLILKDKGELLASKIYAAKAFSLLGNIRQKPLQSLEQKSFNASNDLVWCK